MSITYNFYRDKNFSNGHLTYTQRMVCLCLGNCSHFICMEISKARDRLGKHLSELASIVDSVCGQKFRVDDLLKSLSDRFVSFCDRQ